MAEQIINVRLVDNPLTPEPNDFTGRVQLNGTVYNPDIAAEFIKQRTEFRLETIVNILNVTDGIKRDKISSGYSVIDGVSQMRISIGGTFKGPTAQFNEKDHSKGVIMTPTHETKKAVNATKIVVLGASTTGPVINLIEDVYTGNENGVITPGRNLRIHGQRLRIAGDDKSAATVGVWFIAAAPSATPERIRVDDRDLVDNDPSKLTVVIPELAPGGYFVEIVSQSQANSKQLLKEPRSYRYEFMLTVE